MSRMIFDDEVSSIARPVDRRVDLPEPPAMAGFAAGFVSESPIAAAAEFLIERHRAGPFTPDPGFNPGTAVLPEGTEQLLRGQVLHARSQKEFDFIVERGQREIARRQTMARSGAIGLMGSMLGSIVAPSSLLPLGLGKRGESLLESASRASLLTAGGAVLDEGILRGTQGQRTDMESALSIGGAAMLGAAVGGLGRAERIYPDTVNSLNDLDRGNPSWADTPAGLGPTRPFERAANDEELAAAFGGPAPQARPFEVDPASTATPPRTAPFEADPAGARTPEEERASVGAAAATGGTATSRQRQLDLEALKSAYGLEKIPANPFVRLAKSPLLAARELAWHVTEAPGLFQRKNAEGMASMQSAWTRARRWQARAYDAMDATEKAWLAYRGGDAGKPLRERARIALQDRAAPGGSGQLGYREFREQVGIALNRGDSHPIAQVAEAAKAWRSMFDELDAEVEKLGMRQAVREADVRNAELKIQDLEARKADPKTTPDKVKELEAEIRRLEARMDTLAKGKRNGFGANDTYFPRIWRGDKAFKNEAKLRATLRDYILARDPGLKGDDLDRAVNELFLTTIKEKPFEKLGPDDIGKASAAHERTLDLSFDEVGDFIELDPFIAGVLHARTLGIDLEHFRFEAARFGEGSVNLKGSIAEIVAEGKQQAAIEIAKAEAAKGGPLSAKQKALIQHKWRETAEANVRDLRVLRDRNRGTFGLPDDPYRPLSRLYRAAKQMNAMTMLGMAPITALSDVMRPLMVEGFERGWKTPLKAVWSDKRVRQLGKREAQRAGVALDAVLSTRAFAFSDISDAYGKKSLIERWLAEGTSLFFVVNGMNHWTGMAKEWSGLVVGDRILETVTRMSAKGTAPIDPAAIAARMGSDYADILKAEVARKTAAAPGGRLSRQEAQAYVQAGATMAGVFKKIEAMGAAGKYSEAAKELRARAKGPKATLKLAGSSLSAADRKSLEDIIAIMDDAAAEYDRAIYAQGAGKADLEKLMRSGISEPMASKIAFEFERHGETIEGLRIANTDDWEDLDAVWAYRQALAQDVDGMIITPGPADRPTWMSTELGSVIGQFKSFGAAAVQRVLIAGLQSPERAAFLYGAAGLVAMGGLVDMLRQQAKGDSGYRPRSMREQLVNAVDRSGLLGWFSDINNVVEGLSSNRLGVRPMIGAGKQWSPSWSYQMGLVGGPSVSQLLNLDRIVADVQGEGWDRQTTKALRKLIVGNNLWFAHRAFNEAEGPFTELMRSPKPKLSTGGSTNEIDLTGATSVEDVAARLAERDGLQVGLGRKADRLWRQLQESGAGAEPSPAEAQL
jgi:hypothetical protein